MTPERWQRVQQLFVEAADLAPAERALLLAEECGDDAELRREVERMLAADEEPQPLLDEVPTALAAAQPPAGRLVGPYRILRELGRGGMGTVYLAEREDVGKRVALKLVRGALAAPENLERFLLERRVLARLEHPNIATQHDAGVTEDGTPYFAMEYVRGEPIDRYCETHGLGVPERLALFETLCAAVAHAHQFGRITASRPDDIDAWFQLGEVRYHWMPTLGRPAAEAREAFERVLHYEPDNTGALIHLARIAAFEGHAAELDTLAVRLLRLESGSTGALEVRALAAFLRRDRAEQQRIAAALADDPARAVSVITTVAASGADPEGAARWAGELARAARSPARRDATYVLSVLALAAAGRGEAAGAELEVFAAVMPQAAHELRAALALAPLLEPSRAQLAAAREALARVPQVDAALVLPVSDFAVSPFPPVRSYLLGMLSLRLGESAAAREHAGRLERWQGSDRDRRWARDLARLIRAEALRGERRFEEALRLLRPPAVAPDSLLPVLLSHPKAHERWLRAELLRELGHHQEALHWYASFPDPTAYDLAYLAPAYLRRAEIHERRGEHPQAQASYRRFLTLWEQPDPRLQPHAQQARERLAPHSGGTRLPRS